MRPPRADCPAVASPVVLRGMRSGRAGQKLNSMLSLPRYGRDWKLIVEHVGTRSVAQVRPSSLTQTRSGCTLCEARRWQRFGWAAIG